MQTHPAIGCSFRMSNGDVVTITSQNSNGELLGFTRNTRLMVWIQFPAPVVIATTSGRELGECEGLDSFREQPSQEVNYCNIWWRGFTDGYDNTDTRPINEPDCESFVYWNGFQCGVAMRQEAQNRGNKVKNQARDMEY